MVDFKKLLGDKYDENMSLADVMNVISDTNINLVEWDDDKYTTKAKYITLENQMLAEKDKRKAANAEIDNLKKANMTAEEQIKAENDNLKSMIEALKLENQKNSMKAMYSSLGYSDKMVNELIEVDFYDGEDKISKRNDVMKRANEELISNYKNSILDGAKAPDNNPGSSTAVKKDFYKQEYQKALDTGRTDECIAVINRARAEGIEISL